MPTTLLVMVLAINLTVSTIGDILAKISSVKDNWNYFYIGFIFNLGAIATFMLLIRLGGLATAPSIALVCTILIDVFLGYIYFHEKIEPLQWVGIAFGVIAVILISNLYKVLL